jgi:hypothetical protein
MDETAYNLYISTYSISTSTKIRSNVISFDCFSNFQAQEKSKMKVKDESFEDGVKESKHQVLPTWLQNCKEERVQTMENQVCYHNHV